MTATAGLDKSRYVFSDLWKLFCGQEGMYKDFKKNGTCPLREASPTAIVPVVES
jgi:hypothetical protein